MMGHILNARFRSVNIRECCAHLGLRRFWFSGNIFAAFLLLSQFSAPSAAPLVITAETVTVTRVGASNSFELRQDAISLLGTGDIVRTGSRGRVLVDLAEGSLLLIMPESEIRVTGFERVGRSSRLTIHLDGHIIAQINEDDDAVLVVDTGFLRVSPHGLTALWTDYEGGDVITVHDGSADYVHHLSSESGSVSAGEGFYTDAEIAHHSLLSSAAPYPHAAQLIGIWRGCDGTIVNTGSDALNLRVGPGLASSVIGYSDSGDSVQVLGVNQAGSWYRVQRFSGFGWMRGFYLSFECAGFPVYPNTQVEQNLELRDVQSVEFALIQPFYGTPVTNPWVYRTFRESPYGDG
ncbi:MAG: SH3 domain-containing protein [Anaerolineae bacterium]|nr:SH3 domain-containing protein [Anaerolineae bacterium]NUQ02457.1 SH3 domain-containing protein [Anaerolineae bacterium]